MKRNMVAMAMLTVRAGALSISAAKQRCRGPTILTRMEGKFDGRDSETWRFR